MAYAEELERAFREWGSCGRLTAARLPRSSREQRARRLATGRADLAGELHRQGPRSVARLSEGFADVSG